MSHLDATPQPAAHEMMTNQEYLAANGNLCPHCRSHDINADGAFDADSDYAARAVECNSCQRRWTDTYRLVGWEAV